MACIAIMKVKNNVTGRIIQLRDVPVAVPNGKLIEKVNIEFGSTSDPQMMSLKFNNGKIVIRDGKYTLADYVESLGKTGKTPKKVAMLMIVRVMAGPPGADTLFEMGVLSAQPTNGEKQWNPEHPMKLTVDLKKMNSEKDCYAPIHISTDRGETTIRIFELKEDGKEKLVLECPFVFVKEYLKAQQNLCTFNVELHKKRQVIGQFSNSLVCEYIPKGGFLPETRYKCQYTMGTRPATGRKCEEWQFSTSRKEEEEKNDVSSDDDDDFDEFPSDEDE